MANANENPPVNGMWVPTRTYLIVRDLLIALEDAPPVKRKRGMR